MVAKDPVHGRYPKAVPRKTLLIQGITGNHLRNRALLLMKADLSSARDSRYATSDGRSGEPISDPARKPKSLRTLPPRNATTKCVKQEPE